MGKVKGFLEIQRKDPEVVPVPLRIQRYEELVLPMAPVEVSRQGARCMDCGIPFCHSGCPVNNVIPDWNDLVYRGNWRHALEVLHSTNNFPEFTGRVCPAPCEAACTLNINDQPVTIKTIEQSIVDRGWDEGWIVPQPPSHKTGKRVAVVGSGPAGLACAQELARAGHEVTVFEKNDRIGGLLRYGIPDFKLEKRHVDRRLDQMRAEGVVFRTGMHVGVNLPAKELLSGFDAVVLAGGSEAPRPLEVPGRDLDGIHYAMDYLTQQNKRIAGDEVAGQILATDKHVVVLGGGDTGSDCIGTAVRQGARSVTNFELMPEPPEKEDKPLTWPYWPMKLRTSSSHAEGCSRDFAIATKSFSGKNGKVEALSAVRLDWKKDATGALRAEEIPGSAFDVPADLVLLALGYVHPVRKGMLEELGVALDARGNVKADMRSYQTSNPKVFAAGDMRRGQSLVVWAIREGRDAARAVDTHLRQHSNGV
ncbi:glutamate synthase subunit beta [Polyangium jinanense]|uniref:Glutamate synthase subunit beta n=1 Tax=Polyangium jinanense TaxID=2829994 RepID=A0A9X3XEE6_9BACT|nr:glutamate synthase subunit beta [Polyangium jinanense]MDC3961952.1 glutamate synthase subunit beta [Polyangium jinanense]MDC3988647.1 glutamate synthase subunit beta [Polyangium jinanense]